MTRLVPWKLEGKIATGFNLSWAPQVMKVTIRGPILFCWSKVKHNDLTCDITSILRNKTWVLTFQKKIPFVFVTFKTFYKNHLMNMQRIVSLCFAYLWKKVDKISLLGSARLIINTFQCLLYWLPLLWSLIVFFTLRNGTVSVFFAEG